jgi:hypothetical protein
MTPVLYHKTVPAVAFVGIYRGAVVRYHEAFSADCLDMQIGV